MKIGLHGKEFNRKLLPLMEAILTKFKNSHVELYVSAKFDKYLSVGPLKKFKWKIFTHGTNLKKLNYFISIGGDGTLLDSVTYVGAHEIPILGINTGRLGFLATIGKEETEDAIDKVLTGNFFIDKRAVLKLESNKKLFGKLNFALNDFTLVKKDSSSMITVHAFIDGEFLNSYWADGLIVATPTGSTGYSLSCGGPLVFPRSGNFVITPVSPHNLTVRPIVVPDNTQISFKVEGRAKEFLVSLDSRVAVVDPSVKLKITKERFSVNLIQLADQHYFKTLRQKLNWGLDVRN